MTKRTVATIVAFAAASLVAAQQRSDVRANPPADRFVTVNGLRLHYLDWGGTGRPLILVHGLDRHAHTFDHRAAFPLALPRHRG